MENKKFTYSNAGYTFSEINQENVDSLLYYLDRTLELLRTQHKQTVFTDLSQLGIGYNTETIEKIVKELPKNSTVIHHKHGDVVDMYPQRTGMLTVTKGLDTSRVEFTFRNFDGVWMGFYDAFRGEGLQLWSGWKKIGTTSDGGGSSSTDLLITKGIKTPDGSALNLQSSIDGNNKNLGYSGSRFLQINAVNGYFDTVEVKNPVVVTGSTRESTTKGAYMFDENLGKPIWYNGTKWIDAMGNTV